MDFDDLILGAGMGGLAVGALLARDGRKVGVLEAHDAPGGYAHTFRMRDFRFCAQVHYIFGCGEGETIHQLLDLYDHVGMPRHVGALLAGQCGDYLLPPRDVSLLLHAALVCGYDRGAYYPEKHYFHFVDTIADAIRARPGCALLLQHEVERIEIAKGRVAAVTTANGKRFTARRIISNVDPRRTAR